jgi:hypothetical protein
MMTWLQTVRKSGSRYCGGRRGRILAAIGSVAVVGALAALGATAMAAAGGASTAGSAASAGAAGTARASGAAGAAGALASDSPAGFYYGTDSATVAISGHVPYQLPAIGGNYGGYIGMTGNWANLASCHKIVVWSAVNASQASANYAAHIGIGTGVYWFMGGPGVDPNYNGTPAEAYAWGQRQAARTLGDISHLKINYPVVFMDIEIPGDAPDYTPAPDNGWNTVYTSACSGVPRSSYIPAAVDRADVNGFAAYLTSHSHYKTGVYSAPDIWAQIFGTGATSRIPNTYEWTYAPFTSSLARLPVGWCLSGTSTCAAFFGGQTSASKYALMWQWSGGGGSYNGYGDFDQIDAARMP